MTKACEEKQGRGGFKAGRVFLALMLLVVTCTATVAQSKAKSAQKANESDRVMVSRSVSKADEEPSHPRKGKKGLPTANTKRTESQAPTTKAKGAGTTAAIARKTAGRSSSLPRSEAAAASPKLEARVVEEPVPPPVLAASDRIEVVEWGAKPSSAVQSLPTPAPNRPGSSTRRYEVEMDPGRVQQIQQALISRGFLAGEPTSIYDEATIEAMRQFQVSQKIDSTGYPTAHALKRLGL